MTDHALFFIWNGPKEGRQAQAIETLNSVRAYWAKAKESGSITNVETVMLASTGNHSMPAGFLLVTGERAKLQDIRWNNEEFLNLHAMTMTTMNDYACIDGYAGEGFDKHIDRLHKLMKS